MRPSRAGTDLAASRAMRSRRSRLLYGHEKVTSNFAGLLDVQWFGSGDLAIAVGGDLVDARLSLPQQFLAAPFQRFAAFVNGNRFLKRHLALFEPPHDRFELFDRALEAQLLDVHLGIF